MRSVACAIPAAASATSPAPSAPQSFRIQTPRNVLSSSLHSERVQSGPQGPDAAPFEGVHTRYVLACQDARGPWPAKVSQVTWLAYVVSSTLLKTSFA